MFVKKRAFWLLSVIENKLPKERSNWQRRQTWADLQRQRDKIRFFVVVAFTYIV